MTHCQHCHAETSNGLALCELCQRKAGTILEFLPIYFRNLARWRPGRSGTSRPVPGSRVLWDGHEQPEGTGDRISDTLDDTTNALFGWAQALCEVRPDSPRPLTWTAAVLLDELPTEVQEALLDDPARRVAAICAAFEDDLTRIAATEWCGHLLRELDHHETRLRALTEAYVPGWYAGGCRQLIGFDDEGAAVRCGAATYVVPGLTWVTCSACGATTYARDHLEHIRGEAADWVAPPKRLAEAIVALVDTEQSVTRLYTRIRQWAFVGELEPVQRMGRGYVWSDDEERMVVGAVEVGKARYRMGDVLQLVVRPTRSLKQRLSS